MNRSMRSRFFLWLLPLALVLSGVHAETGAPPEGWRGFGEGVTIPQRTAIEDILSRPEEFSGRTVAVEGEVVGVCQMMGCWIELRDAEDRRLRVKVDDGVIVFPQDALGQRAVAQGVVERLEFSREEALERARHEAEEMDREFDPESVSPPYGEVRLKGTGAWVEGAEGR